MYTTAYTFVKGLQLGKDDLGQGKKYVLQNNPLIPSKT